jgi:cytochrome c
VSIRASTAALALTAGAIAAAGFTGSRTVLAQAASGGALYTDAQAQQGVDPYENNCAMCHGANMEGAQGPTLLGDTFISHYQTVGDLMQFIVQNMPKSDPGALSHEDYVDILAYVLLKNGLPSGSQALSFETANTSKAPLSPPAAASGH